MRGLFLILIALLSSCSTAISHRESYIQPYHAGYLPYAKEKIAETVDAYMPCNAYTKSKDAVWLYLDKATISFATGDLDEAIKNYHLAALAIDIYCQSTAGEKLGSLLFQDDVEAYAGDDFEKVLARVYFALSLIHQGDLGNAHALLRQAEELQERMREEYLGSEITKNFIRSDNPLSKYLFATLLENRGDLTNAEILYNQAHDLNPHVIPPYQAKQCEEKATLIFLCHNGNAPRKISCVSDASIVSTVALEFFLGSSRQNFALSSIAGIPIPQLTYTFSSPPLLSSVCVDGNTSTLTPYFPVGFVAERELSEKLPIISAKALARYLLRRSAIYALSEKNPDLGAIADTAMMLANFNTKADTRQWTTLPQTIDLCRMDLEPGEHSIEIQVEGEKRLIIPYTLILKKGDFCLVNIFNINPSNTQVLIPNRFIKGDNQ